MIIPLRSLTAAARGWLRGLPAGQGFGRASVPHVRSARAGMLDVDLFMHMNNASYLTHCELSRWEMFSALGLVRWSVRERAGFNVAAATMRYRRQIRAFDAFEVHTRVVAIDPQNTYLTHDFCPVGGGPLLAQGLCRAVIKQGAATIDPRGVLAANGVGHETLDLLAAPDVVGPEFEALAQLDLRLKAAATAST